MYPLPGIVNYDGAAHIFNQFMSGEEPYYDLETDVSVIVRILGGHKPGIPEGIYVPSDVKSLMNKCWSDLRPEITSVVDTLSKCFQRARQASASIPPPYSEPHARGSLASLPEYVREPGVMILYPECLVDSPPPSIPVRSNDPSPGYFSDEFLFQRTPPTGSRHLRRQSVGWPAADLREVATSLKTDIWLGSAGEILIRMDEACTRMSTNR